MRFRRSFLSKVIGSTVLVFILMVVTISLFLYDNFARYSYNVYENNLNIGINSINLYLNNQKNNTSIAAVSISEDREVMRDLQMNNMDALQRHLNRFMAIHDINYVIVLDPQGKIIFHTSHPDTVGLDYSNKHIFYDALQGKNSSFFVSDVYSKLAISSGAPVYNDEEELIGIIITNYQMDLYERVVYLRETFGFDVTIFEGDKRIHTTITQDGVPIVGTHLDPKIAEIVINGRQNFTGRAEVFGFPYLANYQPIIDTNGNVFAIFFIGIPLSDLDVFSYGALYRGLILGFIGICISVIILYLIISTIRIPLQQITHEMSEFSKGKLDLKIKPTSQDEIGQLETSLEIAVSTIQRLLGDINTLVEKQEQGITDYEIDSSVFEGDFKVLADNIATISKFGMYDQLTNLPNRRSFNNRMTLEWNRAVRDQDILSVLMVDIDNFKQFNDTYGHQQGDLVLKMVGKILREEVKRNVDFCARWGGEEFVILLVNTSSPGAWLVAERIRLRIEQCEIHLPGDIITHITISIGIHSAIPVAIGDKIRFVEHADEALYDAKAAGRNRCFISKTTIIPEGEEECSNRH